MTTKKVGECFVFVFLFILSQKFYFVYMRGS